MPWVLFTRRWLPITMIVILGSLGFTRLSVWQLDRLAQRRASNARIAYVTSLPPALYPWTEDLAAQDYRAVRLEGVYDFDNQVALRNQARDGEYGFHLLTPFRPGDGESLNAENAVLVDRGWIPAAGNGSPDDWRKYDVAGAAVVEGVVRVAPTLAGSGTSDNTPSPPVEGERRFVLRVDPTSISHKVGYSLPPFYIQAAPSKDDSALPSPADVSLDLSDGPHLGYAVQWFGFALTLLLGYGLYVRRQEAGQT